MKASTPVIITRPTQEAEEFASRLNTHGYTTIIEPSLGIRYNKQPLPAEMKQTKYLVITSARTIQLLITHQVSKDIIFYTVGTATAEKLKLAGYSDIKLVKKNVAELIAAIVKNHPRHEKLVYLRGQDVHTDLTAELKSHGFDIAEFIGYEAILAEQFSDELLDILKNNKPAVVTFFSARTASHFCTLMEQYAIKACPNIDVVCISPAVEKACNHISWKSVTHAASPDADAMFAATAAIVNKTQGNAESAMPSPRKTSIALPALALLCLGLALIFLFKNEMQSPEPVSIMADAPAPPSEIISPASQPTPEVTFQEALDARALVAEQRELLNRLIERLDTPASQLSPETLEQFNAERDAARAEAAMWKCMALLERSVSAEAVAYCKTVASGEMLSLLEQLEPIADTPIETYNTLVQEFDALIPAALLVTKQQADASASWIERIRSNLRALVTVRPTGNVGGTAVEAIIARAEYQLAQRELEKAIEEIETLPEAEQAVFAPWLHKARAASIYENTMDKLRFILTSIHG